MKRVLHVRLSVLRLGCLALLSLPWGAPADWQLVWNDEFNGTAVDTNKWTYDIGTGPPYPGWGNQELQYYTSRPQNVYVGGGTLHIIARKESYAGSAYTSARLKTLGRFSKLYGRFEFRARFPQGQGYWPALWMMPRDSVYGGWAASGEIDIFENRGSDPRTVIGTLHFGGEWPANTSSSGPSYQFPVNDSVTNFHHYALEWNVNSFRWYVDGKLYQTQSSWWSSGGPYPAPFNQPFYLIMNLAVGGRFGGDPDATTVFPGEVQVDYVRVYDYSAAPVPRLRADSVALGDGTVALSGANGPPNGTYYVLATTNLPPLSGWSPVTTNQFDALGRCSNTFPRAAAATFYRLVVP